MTFVPTDSLPDPLVPPEVDLTDFRNVPINLRSLKRSKAWVTAKRNPQIGFYIVNIWCGSWHSVPATSLPNDDAELADLAMCHSDEWAAVRDDVMHGWVMCSDGRFYQPELREPAMKAWAEKLKMRARIDKRIEIESGEWARIRSLVFARDDYTCRYCGARGVRLECDHVIPRSLGGTTTEDNLVTACFDCNRSKGAKPLHEWRPEVVL